MSDLTFAMEILSNRKSCENCYHHRSGRCGMYSCRCATDILNRKAEPSWWMSYEEGEEAERRLEYGE